MIKKRNLAPDVLSLLYGMMIGDVWFVDGDAGNNGASGKDLENAKRTLVGAVANLVSGHHDHILCVGAETGAAAVAISAADAHIIGIGNGGGRNSWNRGFQYTCPAADAFQPTTAADGLELAGIKFFTAGQEVIDDAGADGMFFHDLTFTTTGDTTTENTVICMDIDGKYFTLADSLFIDQDLSVNLAGTGSIVERCIFQSATATAKGVVSAGLHTIVRGCQFNLSHASAVGITYSAAADQGSIIDCWFDGTNTARITNAGANVLITGCFSDTITATTTSTTYTATIT